MSSKYVKINLEDIVEEYGEDRTKSILANFSCELNKDVEEFLKTKAIEFAKQGIASTHLIYYIEDENNPVESKQLVGYFSLTQKVINVHKNALSNKLRSRIHRFAKYDSGNNIYYLPVILIGQLGKNFYNRNNKYIDGKDLLELAIQSITLVQRTISGRFIFLECEDKDKLKSFYKNNDFVQFGKRKLDKDETNIEGTYLLQWLFYNSK